jgi:hypothetical protein
MYSQYFEDVKIVNVRDVMPVSVFDLDCGTVYHWENKNPTKKVVKHFAIENACKAVFKLMSDCESMFGYTKIRGIWIGTPIICYIVFMWRAKV